MDPKLNENKLVTPFFLFFLVHASQTGIGVLTYQTHIIKGAGHDAWLSILAFGLVLHLVFFMMLYIIKNSSGGDIISFHKDLFGNIFGGALNLIMACYFMIAGLFVLYTYIDLLQVWVFDGIPSWEYSLLLCILIYYIVSGGFRIITGIAFWGVIIPSILLLSIANILVYTDSSYLFPLFEYGVKDYFISAKEVGPSFWGLEAALIYFPFIKNRENSSKWGHIALLYTTIMYTVIAIFTFMFFTQGKLEHLVWPTLTMIKIIEFSFLERFEFIFIFTWLLVIMPPICIYLWSAVRAIKLTIPKIKPTYALLFILAGYFYVNSTLNDMYYTLLLSKLVTYSGYSFLFGYIPILFTISLIRNLIKKPKKA